MHYLDILDTPFTLFTLLAALPQNLVELSINNHLLDLMRHATVEVHHFFSEAPHLRSSRPRPKTDLGGK